MEEEEEEEKRREKKRKRRGYEVVKGVGVGLEVLGRLNFDAVKTRRGRTQVNRTNCHVT